MRTHRTQSLAAQFTAALAVLLFSALAFAAGQVQWKTTVLKERSSKSWQLELTLNLAKTPDFANLPMKFEFLPITYFERSMMDGDKLVERAVPLQGRQPNIESVEVGFMDPGTGNIEKRTRFSFKVTRALGYEAGEYRVTIKDARSGQVVGTPQTLKFEGENEIIDRRAMVFGGEKKKKPEAAKTAAAEKAAPEGAGDTEAKSDAKDSEAGADEKHEHEEGKDADDHEGGEDAGHEDGEGSENDDSVSTIKDKPGACGCRTVGSRSSGVGSAASGLGLLLAGAMLVSRRRRAL